MAKKSGIAALGVTGAGAGVGAMLGSGIGIAGGFGAISGVVPLALLGGYFGYKTYKFLTSNSSNKAASFKEGFQTGYTSKAEELRARRRLALTDKAPLEKRQRKQSPKS